MERKELEEKIIAIVATCYSADAGKVTMASRFKEDLNGTSLQMVGLVSEIENELDVTVQLQTAAACLTVSELTDKVAKEL